MENYLNANHYREISIRFIPLNNKKIFLGLIYKSFQETENYNLHNFSWEAISIN